MTKKMKSKIEKVILFFYIIFSLIGISFLVISFLPIHQNLIVFDISDFLIITFFLIPLFYFLKNVFIKKHSNKDNHPSRKLRLAKHLGYILFFTSIIITVYISNIYLNNSQIGYINEIEDATVWASMLFVDMASVIWIFVLLFFSYDFFKNNDIRSRIENINIFYSTIVIFGILIPFQRIIGSWLFELEIFIINFIK